MASTKPSDRFLYKAEKTRAISFPLGGIGTGCVGLAGNGLLADWEIFNRPNKGGLNGFSHFAIRAESGGKVIDYRVLNGDLPTPYIGSGSGPARETMAGFPHFKTVDFRGEFPLATLTFRGASKFPGGVTLTAFNPFIPMNDKDSGIPAAFFEFDIKNTTKKTIDYTLIGCLTNPLVPNNINSVRREGSAHLLCLNTDGAKPDSVQFGDLTLATDADDVSWQQYWFGRGWWENTEIYAQLLGTPGKFKNRTEALKQTGGGRTGLLAAHLTVKAGQTGRVRYVITWNIPNCENFWNPGSVDAAKKAGIKPTWKNYYTTLWNDSRDSALYSLHNWDRLRTETNRFHDTLFESTLPPSVIDAVSANLSVLKSPTVLRLEDGTLYGFEGCNNNCGCCEGSCTHVWNYAQAAAFLFPALERSMRDASYKYTQSADGALSFRMNLPLGAPRSTFRPCVDGQFGDVMKTYRDWKASGDTEWLRSLWPSIKKSIEYAWSPANDDRWDPDKTGVLTGRQHNTLDIELFGPSSWLNGFYLGALKAAAEMAETLGDRKAAANFDAIYRRGHAWTDKHLFNGDYYIQKVDIREKSVVDQFDAAPHYWDAEHKEIKYQLADGCAADQLLPQWHAHLYGLGDIFDPKQAKTALRAVFKNNFRREMREHTNFARLYAINDEAGLLIATWPESTTRPAISLIYSSEVFTGIEYAAAGQMIRAGLVKEGLAVVEAVRARHDGERRNPWNEFECGHNYARSLASYALINTFLGLEYDMTHGLIGFNPIQLESGTFRCFWSLATAWGQLESKSSSARLRVLYGKLGLTTIRLAAAAKKKAKTLTLNGKALDFIQQDSEIIFTRTTLAENDTLKVEF